jgi:hypothetical protein
MIFENFFIVFSLLRCAIFRDFRRCPEPVRLDDQEIAGKMLKRSFRRSADKQPLPAISGYGSHDDDGGVNISAELRQFFVGQTSDKVRMRCIDFVFPGNLVKSLFVVCNKLFFKFFKWK